MVLGGLHVDGNGVVAVTGTAVAATRSSMIVLLCTDVVESQSVIQSGLEKFLSLFHCK